MLDEYKTRGIVVHLVQDPLLEAGMAGVQAVPTLITAVLTDHGEQYVRAFAGDSLSHTHEQIEAAHRLQPSRHERNQTVIVGNTPSGKGARQTPRLIQLGVDAVEMHFDLVLEVLREGRTLPVRRRITPRESGEVDQCCRIDAARIELCWLGWRQIDPVGNITASLSEIVLAVIDDGTGEQLRQKQGWPQSVMPHDEIGLQVPSSAKGVEDGLAQLQMTAKRLRPRRQPLFAELFGQWQPLDLQALEHLHRRSRTTRQVLNQEAALPAVAFV